MDLSIVILNWKSRDYLRACLQMIKAAVGSYTFEVIVIDGASYDGSETMVRDEFPWVQFIQHNENCGFARANNIAARRACGEYILLLNPDTEPRPGAFEEMIACAERLPNFGVLGAKLLNTDGSIQTSCIQAFPTLLNQLLDSDFLRDRTPNSRLWGNAALFTQIENPISVDALSGACLLLRNKVYRELGGFSEDYFMYSEDVDLCHKSRRSGRRNYYIPTAVVMHHGGGSSQGVGSAFSNVTFCESRWKYFRKFHGPVYALIYKAQTFAVGLGRLLAIKLMQLAKRNKEARRKLCGSASKWGAVLKWSISRGAAAR